MANTEWKNKTQNWTVFTARFGYATKGTVYTVLGIIVLKAGLQAGKMKVHVQTILVAILDQPFGQILLSIVILGLIGYAFWRAAQSIFDLDRKGNDARGLVMRVSFFISSLSYALLAYSGARLLLGQSSRQSAVNIRKAVDFTYHLPLGPELVGIVGLILLGVGFYQFYGALSAKFKRHFDLSNISVKTEQAILFLGRMGYTARGVVYLLIGYSLIAAAVTHKPGLAGGYGYAFRTLDNLNEFPWVLVLTAAGMILYGFYAILLARYRYFAVEQNSQRNE